MRRSPQVLAVWRVVPAVVVDGNAVRCLLLHETLNVLVRDQRVCSRGGKGHPRQGRGASGGRRQALGAPEARH